jgi:hypothetical protein
MRAVVAEVQQRAEMAVRFPIEQKIQLAAERAEYEKRTGLDALTGKPLAPSAKDQGAGARLPGEGAGMNAECGVRSAESGNGNQNVQDPMTQGAGARPPGEGAGMNAECGVRSAESGNGNQNVQGPMTQGAGARPPEEMTNDQVPTSQGVVLSKAVERDVSGERTGESILAEALEDQRSGFTSVKPQSKEEKQKELEEHWAAQEAREKEFAARQEKLAEERKKENP